VFDALSAKNLSQYGYGRETMPNLGRLAERAVVYHNHYAGANFTSPGIATLLTGTLPWTNRAFEHLGTVADDFVDKSLFSVFPDHFRMAYTHNPWADIILEQFMGQMERYIPVDRFLLATDPIIRGLFSRDRDTASVSWKRIINRKDDNFAYSLFLSNFYNFILEKRAADLAHLEESYPRGLPGLNDDSVFLLEETMDGLYDLVASAQKPFVSYFHLLPPHAPYRTHRDFYRYFANDGWVPVSKPQDVFYQGILETKVDEHRTWYDESILYVDREFSRFYNNLDKSGLLENTWLIFTSDHGEMFERGIEGHRTPVLYDPIVRVPLLVFDPGRTARMDVYEPTSAVDLLPTLLYVTGQKIAPWMEGVVLPPFSQTAPDRNRSIFALECNENKKNGPIDVATVSLRKGQYKLTYFFGYKELENRNERLELYDLEEDPEELQDLSLARKAIVDEMLGEVKSKLLEVNQPFL
jgi:arylsulfatase A-like enzyme